MNTAQNSIQSPKNDRCPVTGRLPKTESTLSPRKSQNPLSYLLLSLRRLCVLCVSALPVAVDLLVLCFQKLTNPFFRNSRVFTSIQNPRAWRHFSSAVHEVVTHRRPRTTSHAFSSACRLFCSVYAILPHSRPFVFNRLEPLFTKHPGWGCQWDSQSCCPATVSTRPSIAIQIRPTTSVMRFRRARFNASEPFASLSSPCATFCTMAPARYILGGGLTSRFP